MSECNALSQFDPSALHLPWTDLSALPAKLSKRLWVSPQEFLLTIHAMTLAQWDLRVSQRWQPRLTTPSRRGPKPIYADSSVLLMALIHVAKVDWFVNTQEGPI